MSIQNFPINPENGTILEMQDGVIYEYDAVLHAWIKIASNSLLLPLATGTNDGVMSAVDLKKLNRLMIPPPTSTITGNQCYSPFKRGIVALTSGDDLINVEGTVSVQNIDEYGEHISKDVPFQIHQHTYGFDFNLNLDNLVNELISRGQLKALGPAGLRGSIGPTGIAGEDGVLSGPQGAAGPQGLAPLCSTTIQTEVIQAKVKPDLKRALTNARIIIDETNINQYTLEFDRQIVGKIGASTALFHVKQQKSSWVLAVASVAGIAQQIYYIDIEPVINSIHEQFLIEVNRLKIGYEDITKFWIQTMSDLFDEQKAALCCALEFCQSKTNSDYLRQHMESVAAAALPDARIVVNQRGAPTPGGQTYVSGTALWPSVGQPDICAESGAALQDEPDVVLLLDPISHLTSNNCANIVLGKGNYSATISSFDVEITGKYFADIALSYVKDGQTKIARFLNKGTYTNLAHAKSAYEGLSITFEHAGGEVGAYFNMLPIANVSGTVAITIRSQYTPPSEAPAGIPDNLLIRVDKFCALATSTDWQTWLYHFDEQLYRDFIARLQLARGCNDSQKLMEQFLNKIGEAGGSAKLFEFLHTYHPYAVVDSRNI